jgi:hypothetical protein
VCHAMEQVTDLTGSGRESKQVQKPSSYKEKSRDSDEERMNQNWGQR